MWKAKSILMPTCVLDHQECDKFLYQGKLFLAPLEMLNIVFIGDTKYKNNIALHYPVMS